jgi:hypothetical protein
MRLGPGRKFFGNELALVSQERFPPPPRIVHDPAVVHPVERFRSEVNGFAIAREVRRWIFNAGKSPPLHPRYWARLASRRNSFLPILIVPSKSFPTAVPRTSYFLS